MVTRMHTGFTMPKDQPQNTIPTNYGISVTTGFNQKIIIDVSTF